MRPVRSARRLRPVLPVAAGAVVLLLAVACARTVTVVVTPTPLPTATPDIGAEVSARVRQTVAALPVREVSRPAAPQPTAALDRVHTPTPAVVAAPTPTAAPPRPLTLIRVGAGTPAPTPVAAAVPVSTAAPVVTAVPVAAATPASTEAPRHPLTPVPAIVSTPVFPTAVVAMPVPSPTAAPRPTATPRPAVLPRPTATPRPSSASGAGSLSSLYNTQNARWVEQRHPELHRSITRLPWVADGLDEVEREAVDQILYVAVADVSVARELVRMSFMRSYEPADVHALIGINRVIRNGFTADLTSSQVYREGISDEWTPVVAAAAMTKSGPAISEYLDRMEVTVETGQYVTAGLPLEITIVRLKGAGVRVETLEESHQAVTVSESIMQLSLPTRHVIIAFDPRAVLPGAAGVNYGYAISIEEEEPGSGPAGLRNTLYHEVAHY